MHTEQVKESELKMKKLIMGMFGLTEEGFHNRYINDPCFNKGFKALVEIFIASQI
ncbi:MAG TPA: hypothetical protein VFH42_00235 [Sporolactobacillaceae bacterium]|nr:hypothetical protein [Sporolactobacillaceae bacterium]